MQPHQVELESEPRAIASVESCTGCSTTPYVCCHESTISQIGPAHTDPSGVSAPPSVRQKCGVGFCTVGTTTRSVRFCSSRCSARWSSYQRETQPHVP